MSALAWVTIAPIIRPSCPASPPHPATPGAGIGLGPYPACLFRWRWMALLVGTYLSRILRPCVGGIFPKDFALDA